MSDLDFDKPGLREALEAYGGISMRPAHVEAMRAALRAYVAATATTDGRDPATLKAASNVVLSHLAGMTGLDGMLRGIAHEIQALSPPHEGQV